MLWSISETGPDFRKGEFQERQTGFCKVISIPVLTPVEFITDKMSLRFCFWTVCRSDAFTTLNFQLIFYLKCLWDFWQQFSVLSYLLASMSWQLFDDGNLHVLAALELGTEEEWNFLLLCVWKALISQTETKNRSSNFSMNDKIWEIPFLENEMGFLLCFSFPVHKAINCLKNQAAWESTTYRVSPLTTAIVGPIVPGSWINVGDNNSECKSFNRQHHIMKYLDSKTPGEFCGIFFFFIIRVLRAGV